MYSSVDDIEEEKAEATTRGAGRLKIVAGLLLGVAVLAFVAIFSTSEKQAPDPGAIVQTEQYAIYTKALGAPHPALRRARLLDFVQNYPDHDRKDAAEAQLTIIQQADDRDWLSLQEIIFDPAQSRPAKLAALDLYEEMWGSVLLGSRETEVLELRDRLQEADVSTTEPEKTGEDFTPPPDKFDESIDGTSLAGAIVVAERTYMPPAPVIRTPPSAGPRRVIVKPEIRKDRKPRYPSRAQRRGIEAEVVLALNIDDKGEVQMTEVVSVSARKYRKDFVKAAERAALRTKYYPRTIDGKPVATSGFFRKYIFRLN